MRRTIILCCIATLKLTDRGNFGEMRIVGAAPSDCDRKTMPTSKKDTASVSQITDAVEKSMSSLGKFGEHAKLNLEAGFASANAAASGAKAIGSQAVAASKALLEVQMVTARQAAGARTLQDLFNLQASYAKSLFETYSTHTTKSAETLKAAAGEAWAPLGQRVGVALKSLQSVDG